MIKKPKLSVQDIRDIPVGAKMEWQLKSGASILSARNIISYIQRHDGRKFTTKADFVNNSLMIERLS